MGVLLELSCVKRNCSNLEHSHQFIQNIQIWLKSNSQAIEVYLCPDDIKKEPEDNITNEASSSSASDEHLSEDSTSCDSFKSKLPILCLNFCLICVLSTELKTVLF